jgi:hypothetical protein
MSKTTNYETLETKIEDIRNLANDTVPEENEVPPPVCPKIGTEVMWCYQYLFHK